MNICDRCGEEPVINMIDRDWVCESCERAHFGPDCVSDSILSDSKVMSTISPL